MGCALVTDLSACSPHRCLCWLGHISCMQEGQFSKHIMYGKTVTGTRPAGRPVLHHKDIYKGDLKECNINTAGWEAVAADQNRWRLAIKADIQKSEKRREDLWEVRREDRRQKAESALTETGTAT